MLPSTGDIMICHLHRSNAAEEDFVLISEDGTQAQTATVRFEQLNSASTFFDINVTCDGILEGEETCDLVVTDIRPGEAPFVGMVGTDAVLNITDCESDSESVTTTEDCM